MARYRPSQLLDSITGSLGSSTFTQWKGLKVVKAKISTMSNPQTDKQVRARQNLTEMSKAWNKLFSPNDRAAWNQYAAAMADAAAENGADSQVPSVIPARKTTMSGFNASVRLNTSRATGVINHQNTYDPVPDQQQSLIPAGDTIAETFVPAGAHITPLSPDPTASNRVKQSPPIGVQPPGQPKIITMGISEAGVPGDFTESTPVGTANGFNSPPATEPNFIHIVIELPPEEMSGAADVSGILVPADVEVNPDVPIKQAVRLWKKGPEATGGYVAATVPFVNSNSGGYSGQRVAEAGDKVEVIFKNLPTASTENPEVGEGIQTTVPPMPGLHEAQADVVSDDGQVGPPSNEFEMVLGQPQNPVPGKEDEKDPEVQTVYTATDEDVMVPAITA